MYFGPLGPFAVPVGERCLHCHEPIAERDVGSLMPVIRRATEQECQAGAGEWAADIRPLHADCDIRMSVGSVAHLEGKCSCTGWPAPWSEDDPPGMTRREAATAAADLFRRMTREGSFQPSPDESET